MSASWGAAFFGVVGQADVVLDSAMEFLGPGVSNNVAEYLSLRACLVHARRAHHNHFCVQMDSLLVVQQVKCQWACRNPSLVQLFAEIRAKLREFELAGVEVLVEHIYREDNKVADRLANVAIDSGSSSGWRWTFSD